MNIIMSRQPQQQHHNLQQQQYQQQQHYPQQQHHRTITPQLQQQTPPPITPSSPLDFTEKIPFNELRLSNETLGSGSFGTVFKGFWRNRSVAVKQFRTREEIDSFLVEVKQLSCVRHPNIVTLFGSSVQETTAYLVMEYAEGGSLNHLLHENKQQPYDLRHACTWALQTARGVTHLHEMKPKPIMHRDLKPANLLLFSRGKTLKICDFGTACTVKTQMTNNTGSASYMAPEVFATSNYLVSGDVYSWSIIFWEILARLHPYSQQCSNPYQILWRVKQNGTRPNELENCPKIIWSLITRCWDKDPLKRPTMRQVASEMEFISSFTPKTPSLATATTTTNAIASIAESTSNSQFAPIPTTISSAYANYISGQMIYPYQNINNLPQSRGLSSAEAHNHSVLPLPSPQHNRPHPAANQALPSSPGCQFSPYDISPSTIHKRKLFHHRAALIHRLERLKKDADDLTSSEAKEEIEPYKVIDEIKKLQEEERRKSEELKQRSQSILVKTYNNLQLNSSRSIDCE